jgi:hypothetical protein
MLKMKYRETITARKTILRKTFRIRYTILITELRFALNNATGEKHISEQKESISKQFLKYDKHVPKLNWNTSS